ncbi:class I SAM-dependent methyltransferase [Salinibacter sp.]|uniref:class I SAM-dependent methyltransferase n=1 Tax=Salinibacter sp. TaxID=2065818 RepID=UPI0021E954A1|nr:methyltransferase domain-containing protein [Salinibacter sp.]
MISDLLRPDRSARKVRPEIHSALSAPPKEAAYDSRAAGYDWVVGGWLYNRLLWGTSTGSYRRFARRALDGGKGPFLDVGAGSAVFTADAYAQTSRPLVLVDRAVGMLEAARERIAKRAGGSLPGRITLLQADARDLPLRTETMVTVLSMGLLHVVGDMRACTKESFRVLRPGGTLYATSLVTDRALGRWYLRLLHKAGEVARPKAEAELRGNVESVLGRSIHAEREGNMAFLTAETPPEPGANEA